MLQFLQRKKRVKTSRRFPPPPTLAEYNKNLSVLQQAWKDILSLWFRGFK